MSRLIDADLLEKEIYKWMPKDQETWMSSDIPPIEDLVVSIMMTIQEQPKVDAVPVRHGRWIEHTMSEMTGYDPALSGDDPVCSYSCSVCGEDCYVSDTGDDILSNYCPNCGAKMDERKQNNDSD